MKNSTKNIIVAVAVSLQLQFATAGAVIGATEPTQILNNIQLMLSYAESAQQTVQQIGMYQSMLKNLATTTPSGLLDASAQQLWNDQNMTQAFGNLRRVVIAGQSMSYDLSNFDANFKKLNPGYGNSMNFQSAYSNWSNNTLDRVSGALKMVAAQAQNFQNEQSMISELSGRSRTADGQMKALQAGNDIGVAMVGQLQQLRQLQMAQMQAQNAYVQNQQGKDDLGTLGSDKAYQNLDGSRLKP